MVDLHVGDRVEVDVNAGIVPGTHPGPDWQTGTLQGRAENGMYVVRLDTPIGGREALKEAAPEHVRRA